MSDLDRAEEHVAERAIDAIDAIARYRGTSGAQVALLMAFSFMQAEGLIEDHEDVYGIRLYVKEGVCVGDTPVQVSREL